MRRLWVAACTVAAASAVLPVSALTESASWPGSHALSRAEQPLHSYTAFRRMHAYSEDQKHEAWMEARTELKNHQFSYTIVSETGSEAIRARVLRAVLAREQDMVSKVETGRADLTAENYEFTDAGRDETGARVVQIKPRRADVMLVDGRAVLSDSGDLLRIEGKLSKNPSFWTSLVNIVRHYARVGGIRVPVATETTAKVKFVGNSQLDVFYDYESVNGRPVSISERRSAELSRIAER
jgi:hypothetical protein